MKLSTAVGDDGKKSNWHHFNIPQRIDFLRKCVADPGLIKQHDKKMKRLLQVFFSALLFSIYVMVSFGGGLKGLDQKDYLRYMEKVIEKRLILSPDDPELHSALGQVYYEQEKWPQAKKALKHSLDLKYRQPEVLNNLAWLLVTCPEKEILDPAEALKLAREAVKLREAPHIYDTLAEALQANEMYEEGVAAAEKAVELAKENRRFYKDQLEKKKERLRQSKTIKI